MKWKKAKKQEKETLVVYHREADKNVVSDADREVGKRMLVGARAALEGHPSAAVSEEVI